MQNKMIPYIAGNVHTWKKYKEIQKNDKYTIQGRVSLSGERET